ncbi:23S rRNA Gm-2251 2'-O-methyltransferase [Kushneria sinocarnis]|uniref:23S rRNA (guanosine-2'-O-)-methyltransferase RlmB n=1 Tax=Kushneria sinocarnis TaxID=595502 RepID=A0A420WZH0_9GAMM|nr:23S rRNA (guanosine(2251)-2'-O)-methyltransferase RlmB [Kushneria sinocarnis]RKR06629.1 23S rRNA Gm-2251 2'-O-methyltransferase [Kushneria sinocarnis]
MSRSSSDRGRSSRSRPRRAREQGSGAGVPGAPRGLEPVFGVHAVEALLAASRLPALVWVQSGAASRRLALLIEQMQARGAELVEQPRERLDAIAEGAHQGIVAFCEPLTFSSEEALFRRLDAPRETPALLLILDGITDVHNFGACLRSADGAGVDGVIVAKDRSAPLNATVRKIASGAAESVPVYQVTNLARAMTRLRDAGIWLVGAAGEATAELFEVELSMPCAIVMGSEGKGLRRLTREHCDHLVRLPMVGQVESLNVSVATGICLYEALRQRRALSAG